MLGESDGDQLGLALGESDGENDGDMLGLALGEIECGAALTFTLWASTAMACPKKSSPPSSKDARSTPAVRSRPTTYLTASTSPASQCRSAGTASLIASLDVTTEKRTSTTAAVGLEVGRPVVGAVGALGLALGAAVGEADGLVLVLAA